MFLDGMPDIAKLHSWLDHLDPKRHAIVSGLYQPLCSNRCLTHQEHLARIPVEPVLDNSDIDVDDIPGLELLVAGNTMADNVVNGSADGFWKALVIQGCRHALLFVNDVIMADFIKLSRGHPGNDVGFYHL